MKIVVIGGTGLIGSKLVGKLAAKGHEAIAASPNTGVNTLTGEGLAEVLQGTDVVVDLSNSPSFEDKAVLDFFTISGRNLMAAEKAAGVGHHIAVSIVGTDRLPESGYLRAKMAQETAIKAGGVPYTILRSTQFFEFLRSIANSAGDTPTIALPTGLVQPVAAEDLANALVEIVLGSPLNGTTEIAGPKAFPMAELVGRYLKAMGDQRVVKGDTGARYFGTLLEEKSLVPHGAARITPTPFETWIATGALAK